VINWENLTFFQTNNPDANYFVEVLQNMQVMVMEVTPSGKLDVASYVGTLAQESDCLKTEIYLIGNDVETGLVFGLTQNVTFNWSDKLCPSLIGRPETKYSKSFNYLI